MWRGRRLGLLAIAVTGTSAALALTPVPQQPTAHAAEDAPTVGVWTSASDGTRLDGDADQKLGADQQVTVRWKGFTPNSSVVLTQCVSPGRAWYQYNGALYNYTEWHPFDWCAPQTRQAGTTKADGTGSATFTVKQGTMAPSTIYYNSGSSTANTAFTCTANAACVVIASECEWQQPLQYHTDWPQALLPQTTPPAGVDEPARAAASQNLNFAPGSDGKPITSVVPALRPPDFPTEKPPPVLEPVTGQQVGAPIYGTGASNVAMAFETWLTGVRSQSQAADVSFSRTTSMQGAATLKSGFQSKFTRGADFAVTGVPYDKDTVGGDVAYAPISLTALAIANEVEIAGRSVREVRMSPLTVAWMLGRASAPNSGPLAYLNGYETSWGALSPAKTLLALDNHGCELPPRDIVPLFRLGQSAQNQVLSAWLGATIPKDLFDREFAGSEPGGLELLATQAGTRGTTTGAETARQIATQFGDLTKLGVDGKPDPDALAKRDSRAGLGYVDITEVKALAERGFPLGVSALKNAAGKYVAPTKDSILAAFSTMKKNTDGIYTAVFDDKDQAGAYPLPMVHYIAVPKPDATGKNPLPLEKRKALSLFIKYAVSDAAQARIEQLGGAPLPKALRDQSNQVADMLLAPDPTPSSSPSPTPSTSQTSNNGNGNGGTTTGGTSGGGTRTEGGTPGPADPNADVIDGNSKPAPTVTITSTHRPTATHRATTTRNGGSGTSTRSQNSGSRNGGSADTSPHTGADTHTDTHTGADTGTGTDTGAGAGTGTGQGQPPAGNPQPSPVANAQPAPQTLANEGTVRGGTIPAPSWVVQTSMLMILGAIALSLGGTWRGYLLWKIRSKPSGAAASSTTASSTTAGPPEAAASAGPSATPDVTA
ncbi:hypothetical protein [Planotetraspora sp. GP83]|uniref:hypothetical protein n=1 Tax=Planotetraspora sp. GP83 TaxID=3156264 RepID=UPI003517A488